KPLYYAPVNEGRGLAFASEMKALFPFPGLDNHLDVPAIAQFLALGYVPAPRTHFHGVRMQGCGRGAIGNRESSRMDPNLRAGKLRWRASTPEFCNPFVCDCGVMYRSERFSPGAWTRPALQRPFAS